MPLGIEQNTIAPRLIQDSGQALVQSIRQMGQGISANLTEMQTRRDMAAMAQEMHGLNVQSEEFPLQLMQLASRHPMAIRDERGQMALSIVGKAHGQWREEQNAAAAFSRAMQMQDMRSSAAREQFDYENEVKLRTPQNIGGSLVIPRDEVTGQPNVLLPAPARQSSALPFASTPQGIMDRRTGEITAPLPEKPASVARERLQLDRIRTQLTEINKAKDQVRKKLETNRKREAAFMDLSESVRRTRVAELAELHKERQQLESLEQEFDANAKQYQEQIDAPVEVVGAAEVLPVIGEIPEVMTIEEARKLPPGTKFKSPDGKLRIR